jgi:hypothetical protein
VLVCGCTEPKEIWKTEVQDAKNCRIGLIVANVFCIQKVSLCAKEKRVFSVEEEVLETNVENSKSHDRG